MTEKNLLIVIIDTNPFWWALQSSSFLKTNETVNTSNKDYVSFAAILYFPKHFLPRIFSLLSMIL
jgi:hypothetical protein